MVHVLKVTCQVTTQSLPFRSRHLEAQVNAGDGELQPIEYQTPQLSSE